jgi:ferredoxin-thioredoxin reductase catalytic subunit
MSEINLRERLCLQFCPYYKPLKNKEFACKGFLVVEGLIKEGKNIPFKKSDLRLEDDTEKSLRKNLCIPCPFHDSDCDFAQGEKGACPCGGFLLLGSLLETQVITIDNINDILLS